MVIFQCSAAKSESAFWTNITMSIYGAEFCTIGITHLVMGIYISKRLRRYPCFHANYKNYLNLITLCLSIPVFLRGIIELLEVFSHEFEEWYKHTGWALYFFFLLCDYMPLTSNLSSMLFGVIRCKD